MVIVDTSVWVEVFRRIRPLDLTSVISFDQIVTCLPVVQEVIQGFSDERAFRKAREAMWNLPIVESPLSASLFGEAVDLFRLARKRGLTVRSSIDCLIAAIALRHGLEVIHRDRDFEKLAQVSQLRERQAS